MKRVLLLLAASTAAAEPLPLNPAVTRATIDETVCVIGWTKTVRPPYAWSNAVKIAKLREIGLTEASKSRYEADHIIPLCAGGAPADPRNIQLQPWPEAVAKDRVESCLCRAVCAGRVDLDEARRVIWADWRKAAALCD